MNMLCPRCGFRLQPVDDAPPPYCAQCGLQQLRIAQDALSPTPVASQPAGTSTPVPPAGSSTDWPLALRLIGMAALLGVVPPACLPGALTDGVVSGLALLLLPMLTLGVLSLYYRTRPHRPMTPSIGVRMGATLGMMMGLLIAFVTGVAGFVLRYGYHSRAMDEKIEQTLSTLPAQLAAAGPTPPELLGFLQSPEFRAGTFILSHVLSLLLLMLVASICGWLGGSLLRARRQRHIG